MCNRDSHYDTITMKGFIIPEVGSLIIYGTIWKDGARDSGFHHEMGVDRFAKLIEQAEMLGLPLPLDFSVEMEKVVEVELCGVNKAVQAMLEDRHDDRTAAQEALQFRMIGACTWI